MSVNNPNSLSELAVFVAVAESAGFSAAARKLGVSKAMVSVTVSKLEQRLGARLFQRTTRRLSLTEAGSAALAHAQRAVAAAHDAEEAATRVRSAPRGPLRVSAPMSFGLLHVAPALAAFATKYPEVQVDLVLDDRVVDLIEGGFDVALRIGNLADSALIAQRLGTSRSVIAAHPSYIAKHGTPRSPSDLSRHAALLYSLSSSGNRWTLRRHNKSETVRVRGPLRVNSSLALQTALTHGLGLARMPRFVVHEALASGQLVEVLPEWHLPEQGIFAVTSAREHLPDKTRAFIDHFRALIGEPAYWERASKAAARR